MITTELQALEVEIKSLKHYHGNPKLGNVEAIRESLRQNGQYRPLVVRRATMEILAGNHTWDAAKEEGWKTIWVNFVDCDDETAARINLADNRTAELGSYNQEQLVAQLGKLPDLVGTGYTTQDADRLAAGLVSRVSGDTDAKPRPKQAVTKRGDLYILGPHRLMCGDSTVVDDVAALVSGEEPVCAWIDTAYIGSLDMSGRGPSAAGASHSTDSLKQMLTAIFKNVNTRLKSGSPVYLRYPGGSQSVTFGSCYEAQGWRIWQTLVWIKGSPNLAYDRDYHDQHELLYEGEKPEANAELITYGGKGRRGANREHWYGDRKQCSLLYYERPRGIDHPTAYPVGLVEQCLVNSTPRKGLIHDPCAGSGTTLLAAHNIGRRVITMEIDPGYCDVIVDRWERHTGGQAVKVRARPDG